MKWQDIVFGLSYLFFSLALLPSIKSKAKPALQTSLTTGGLNVVMVATQLSLGLWFGALGTVVNSSLWFILAYQKMKQTHASRAKKR
jgi:hypothetical protein